MMKTTLAVFVLLLAACGEDVDSDATQDQTSKPDEDFSGSPPGIAADFEIYTITCVETIARFRASIPYADDGSPVGGLECLWTFDDGTTSTECAGEHRFAEAGNHDFVLEVTDPATGAKAIATQTRFFYPPLELTLDVTTDDLSITWKASSNTGGMLQVVTVTPHALVIADDPNYHSNLQYTVRVAEPGTYTVTYDVEDERGVSEICNARIEKQVEVMCGHDDHDHTDPVHLH
jgi:hypothetical protein